MRFVIQITSGGEVVFAGHASSAPVYYGAPAETGLWKIDLSKFENFIASKLKDATFGDSVDEFRFGFEIAELTEWGEFFTKLANYISYRPSSKTLISVGQIEWREVKDLSVQEQFSRLCQALEQAIARVGTMKRKPKQFDYAAFYESVKAIVATCDFNLVSVDA